MSLHKRSQESIGETPKTSKDKGNKVRSTPKRRLCDRIVKSPSDTTLYTPTLKKGTETNNVIDHISDFVEMIRIQEQHAREWPSTSRHQQPPDVNNINSQRPSPVRGEHDVVEQMILDAERFKGNVTAPKGNELMTQVEPIGSLYNGLPHLPPEIEMLCRNDNDDDFFHITCHIDPSLRLKIEKGKYVELDRLLAKDNNTRTLNEDKRIELVSRGGATFFAPVQDRDTKINSVCKWEQAFRIYAAIYTRVNPERASEVWQYVYVINTATLSYHWDNVAYYDVTFRQLMAVEELG